MMQTAINSLTTQKIIDEHVQPDTFTSPLHTLPGDVRKPLNQLLETFKSQFAQDETSIWTAYPTKMQFDTGNSESISQKPYPIAVKHYDWVRNEINKLQFSSWSTSIIIVPKGDGGKCLVINYRVLTKITEKFVWPMPRVEDIFSKLKDAKYFSTLNACTGYHQKPLDEDSVPKTAFTSPFGKYMYLKVPFGLAQVLAYFQDLMNKVLKDSPFTIAYLDDMIIYSKSAKEHLGYFHKVFQKLHDAKSTMKLSRCHFFAKEIQYLGHIHSNTGIKPLPPRQQLLNSWTPRTAKQVRAFLGLVDYYHRFIKNFAHIAKPLTALTQHDAKFTWTSGHLTAFNTLKSALLKAPILCYPHSFKCYIVYTDASDDTCGAHLSQEHNGQELPVAFPSCTFMHTQCKWSTTEQEPYGVYHAVTK